ncbi:uncharacterized protein LOC110012625 [Sesamum indicum]|uniref:Uncharacterized protein LOC110012625 n=1 Tax=Sesamum indicum TaxID=4182 RepID=A0A8M8V999_SESIN|nr:uncharacterized protein LOC110012625 [Sesamum indicum]
MHDNVLGGHAARNPPSRSSKGTSTSSKSKGKRHAPLAPGTTLGTSSKKTKMSLWTLLRPALQDIPHTSSPFSLRDEGGVPFKSFRTSSNSLYTRPSLEQEKEKDSPMVVELMRGMLTSGDKRLLASITQEEPERMISTYLVKATSLCEEFLCPQGAPPVSQGMPRGGNWRTRWSIGY